MSSKSAASRLTSWAASDMSAAYQEVDQHAEHREQERGREEFRRHQQAYFRQQGLDECETRTADGKLECERDERERQRGPVARPRDAPRNEQCEADRHVGEELDRGRPFDER